MAAKPDLLPAIRSSAALEAEYSRRLRALIEEMQNSLVWWIEAAYKAKPPEMAGDEAKWSLYAGSPATVMGRVMKRLSRRWERRFNDLAPKLAEYYATEVQKRNDRAMQVAMRKAGLTVKFQMTAQMNDVLRATIGEQVGLIKSIAQQHLSQVEGLVMRSVQKGGDLSELSKELKARYGVTRRRAELISRDQVSKATATMQRVRQLEIGIETAVWKHSHAGKVPRKSHVANDGKEFDLKTGWYDPEEGRYVLPGELINCRCFSRPVIKGLLPRAA